MSVTQLTAFDMKRLLNWHYQCHGIFFFNQVLWFRIDNNFKFDSILLWVKNRTQKHWCIEDDIKSNKIKSNKIDIALFHNHDVKFTNYDTESEYCSTLIAKSYYIQLIKSSIFALEFILLVTPPVEIAHFSP